MQKFIKRWLWRFFLLLIAAVLAYQLWILGHVVYWNFYNPSTSAFMQDRLHDLRNKDSTMALRTQWMPYERISPHLKRAIIAAEDGKFLELRVRFRSIQKAYEKKLKKAGWLQVAPLSASSLRKPVSFRR